MHVLSSITYIPTIFSVRHSGTHEFLGLVWTQRRDSFCLSDWFGRNMRLGCSKSLQIIIPNHCDSVAFAIYIYIYLYIIVYTRNLTQKEVSWNMNFGTNVCNSWWFNAWEAKKNSWFRAMQMSSNYSPPESRIDTSEAIMWFNSKGGWCLVNPHCFGDEFFTDWNSEKHSLFKATRIDSGNQAKSGNWPQRSVNWPSWNSWKNDRRS